MMNTRRSPRKHNNDIINDNDNIMNNNNNNNNNNKRFKREISGLICHLSPIIEYTNGPTIYIHIISNDNNNYYIVLTHKQCLNSIISILTVGSRYTFKNIERSDSIIDNIMESNNINDLSNYWLRANDKCEIIQHIDDDINDNINFEVYSFDQLIMKYNNFIEPSISDKIIYENIEMNIIGYIDELYGNGILKMVTSVILPSYENELNIANGLKPRQKNELDNSSFIIFLTPSHIKSYSQQLVKGSCVKFYSVFPMYLWGNFVGFAATIRSHIWIDNNKINSTINKDKSHYNSSWIKNKPPLLTAWLYHIYQNLHSMSTAYIVANKILEQYPDSFIEDYNNVRREFTDVLYTQLYSLRAGYDSDWLSSKLPSLWVHPTKATKLYNLYQSNFESIRDVRLWKIAIMKTAIEKSPWEIATGILRSNVLVANIIDCITKNSQTINCIVLRICNRPGLASMLAIIMGDEMKLRSLNNDIQQNIQHLERKILIEKFSVLFEIPPVELDDSLKSSMEIPTYVLAQADDIKIVTIDNKKKTEMKVTDTNSNTNTNTNTNTKENFNSDYVHEYKMYSVRHALMRRPHCSEVPLPMLVGVVIRKVLVGNFDCNILIRDLVDCDTIAITMTAHDASNIISGLIISIKNSKMCSNIDDITYKYTDDSKIDIIGIDPKQIDLINDTLLERFPMQSYISKNKSVNTRIKTILPRLPPRYRLSTMYMTKSYNRCSWTFLGQVTFVRMFGINLKCQTCFASCKFLNIPFECKVCRSRHLYPTWEAEVIFDDGSAECRLFVEGDDVFKLLSPESLQMRNKLLRLKGILENLVYLHGSICYTSDSILLNGQKKEAKDWSEETFMNQFDNNDEYLSLIETTDWTYNIIDDINNNKSKSKNEEDAIDAIKEIRSIQKMRPTIEICARLKGKINLAPYIRTVKVQEDNSRLIFCNNQMSRKTLANNHIEMICYSVNTLDCNDTILEAYQILEKLGIRT